MNHLITFVGINPMLTKEEIHQKVREPNIPVADGVEILRSYIYLKTGREIDIIPPRDVREGFLFQKMITSIRNSVS